MGVDVGSIGGVAGCFGTVGHLLCRHLYCGLVLFVSVEKGIVLAFEECACTVRFTSPCLDDGAYVYFGALTPPLCM